MEYLDSFGLILDGFWMDFGFKTWMYKRKDQFVYKYMTKFTMDQKAFFSIPFHCFSFFFIVLE